MDSVRVYMPQNPGNIADSNGVGRVIHAQYRYLPQYGVELVESPEKADVLVSHITKATLPYVDILSVHGLYWTGDKESGDYIGWHHEANALILAAAREARAITVPSEWVAMPFKRDMRISPTVIGHGIEADEWLPRPTQDYVLWNKNRPGDVCTPLPAWELANRGFDVVSTFGVSDRRAPPTLRVIGTTSHDVMQEWIRAASVYLATTKETFGIGTLEAMAAGVPILGYAWGGTLDIVEHGVTGWLVQPGDIDGLVAGLEELKANRKRYSIAAIQAARQHTWQAVMAKYAALYHRVAEEKWQARRGCSVVITCYNYERYVGSAIESCLSQRVRPDEIIVVDDGSTDNSKEIIESYGDSVTAIYQQNKGVAAARNAGIEAATQEHIICLDADDELDPRYIRTLLPALQKDRSLGIAYAGLLIVRDDGKTQPAGWPPEFAWESQAAPGNPPSNCIPCAAMFRRDMWKRSGGYQQVWAPGEDAEFWARGLSVGFGAKRVTEEPLLRYRVHSGSASRTKIYKPIDAAHPWMTDKLFPMAAPAKTPPLVRSYSEPAVSVIIPVGPGHGKYLSAALDSLLAQTCREWEAVVINDSGEPLDLTPYPFVRLFETEGKQGAGRARNIGIEQAKAPLVLFLDADDWLQPSAIQRMLTAHIDSDGKYIYSGWIAINGERSTVDEPPPYSQQEWLYSGQHAVTALIPLEWCKAVGGFDEEVMGWEDWDFFVKLAINGYCGAHVIEPLLAYRQHTGTRREDSLANRSELLALLRERYAEYGKGKPMARCCGGSKGGETLIAAKRATQPQERTIMEEPTPQAFTAPVPSSYVRMEFIGQREGAVTYQGKNGRSYRFGRHISSRFRNVHKDDVDKLLSLGMFRVVERAIEQAPAAPKPAPKPREITPEEASAALMQAKADAARELAAMAVTEAPKVAEVEEAAPAPKVKRTRKSKKKSG